MVLPDMSQTPRQAMLRLERVLRDTGAIFQALGAWGAIFFLTNLVLGLLPLGLAVSLSKLVDAMIGARGIGTMTSEVTGGMWRFLLLMVVAFISYLFIVRFKDRSATVGAMLRDVTMSTSLLIFLIVHQQIGLSFGLALLLLLDTLVLSTFRARLVCLAIAILVSVVAAEEIIRFTVHRAFTVGEGLAILAAIAMLLALMKMRLARHS